LALVPQHHFEPFLHLVDVTHDRALVAWGGFFFERPDADHRWKIVDDQRLGQLDPGRTHSIGARSEPYGDVVVEAFDADGVLAARSQTSDTNHAWLHGLVPDTGYSYRVAVDGAPWAEGERWDWGLVAAGGLDLRPQGRSYGRRLRTHPAPDAPSPLTFAVIGDFGVGITADTEPARRQRRVADVLDRLVSEHGVRLVLTVGDNVYTGEPGRVEPESGSEDDDWYASFYAPYRYVLGEVPVYPAVGNHDTGETENSDERTQIAGNFHIDERFGATDEGWRASSSPGLNYRLTFGSDIEFISIDTTESPGGLRGDHFFQYPEHQEFLERALPPEAGARWRIPFSHHPAYCAGPNIGNNPVVLEHLVPLFRRAGVRAVFAGHEHNFQLCRADGISYVTTGAGGKVREDPPSDFTAAGAVAWAAQSHCLLVEIVGDRLAITPVAAVGLDGELEVMTALSPDSQVVAPPFMVTAR
jgi:tartrate-resistant acid phosphatase type 5